MKNVELFDKEILRVYRKLLFPAIGDSIITGYNVYKDKPKECGEFVLDYLHSDLKIDENGKFTQPHGRELLARLQEIGKIKFKENITTAVMNRFTNYEVQVHWENPLSMKFYDKFGREIPKEELSSFEDIIIGEDIQYDLKIELNEKKSFIQLLDILNKYAYRYEVDKEGNIKKNKNSVRKPNKNAITYAWDVPVIILNNKLNRKDYVTVNEIILEIQNHEADIMITTNDERLKNYLEMQNKKFKEQVKYANRVFVDDVLNSRRAF